LGIGMFKTAHPGHLSLVHLFADGIGTSPNEYIAVKRMYVQRSQRTEANPTGFVIGRLTAVDEFRKTLMEANVLLWATSIIRFTYSFIHHFIANSSHPPPFEIPEVRFVHGGVAVVYEQLNGPIVHGKSTICRSYLLEEVIDEQTDGFHKFINNGDAMPVPHITTNPALSALAEFLSFTQHVQYYKTNGAVYLSDLQGSFHAH
ncbi:hypothetical protein C8R44DRAFT_600608, partial [Mycena epipterygia]